MLKFTECTGKNEEEAIAAALKQLGLDRDDVSVEVLERAKSGFLGIGSAPARVRVSYEVPGEPEAPAAPPEPEKPREVSESAPKAPAKAPSPRAEAQTGPAPEQQAEPEEDDRAEKIMTFLTGLLERMEVSAVPQISRGEDGSYEIVLEGQDLGALIGRRGETLDAIQQLTSYCVNRGHAKRARIHVDAEHYRSKREESLQRLARKVAGKVVKYRRNVTLEPMNAYERHVIHAALQEYPDVTTYSTGTEPNRRTVVAFSRGEHR